MQPVNLVDLLFSGQDVKPQEPVQPIEIVARVLLDIMPETMTANPFKVGDLVQQKAHLDIYKFPAAPRGTNAGGVAVVLAVFEPTRDHAHDLTDYQMNDMVIGTVAPGGSFRRFEVESFRFQKYEGEVA